jgi:3'-phosphoadenosine 5'-phosphosulfate sulfotransferase (PAPS reductase)/FAD synthetase
MSDPFFILGPATISFSGGRTSAYMLWRILRAHFGILPDGVVVVFANTGKEREETLRFVKECGERWRVPIHWVEWRRGKPGFAEVDFETASRDGEPFEALIASKSATPNWQARWCTMYLKVQAMSDYLKHSFGWAPNGYAEVIGLRHDEPWRIVKMKGRNIDKGRNCVAPLYEAGVNKAEVMAFWARQPFDLGLQPHEGNCDLCFMKGRGLRKRIISDDPSRADWWVRMEEQTGRFFDRRDSYADLVEEVRRSPELFDAPDEDEHDTECDLICGFQEAAV